MITKSFIIRKVNYDWMKNVCDIYDLDLENLIFLMVEYARDNRRDFLELFSEESYVKFMSNKTETYMGFEVMLTETLNNLIEKAVEKTIYTTGYFLDRCIEFVSSHFEDFERWYDNNHLSHAEGIPGVPVTLKQRKEKKNNE